MQGRTCGTKLHLNFASSSAGKDKRQCYRQSTAREPEARPGLSGTSTSQRCRDVDVKSKLDMQSEGTGNSEDLTGGSAAVSKSRDVLCLLRPSL